MPSGEWVFDPGSGGVKISDAVKRRTEARIRAYAEANFAGKFTRLEIRFRGQFCYIDAYTYSNEKYSLSVYENGEFFGIPEDAFQAAANAYLIE